MSGSQITGFIQEMTIEGNKVDLGYLSKATLVETLDLSGPQLILDFHDPAAQLRDQLGAKERAGLNVVMFDVAGRGGMASSMDFIILTSPNHGQSLRLNCLQKDLDVLHTPALKSQYLNRIDIQGLVSRLCPGARVEAGAFPSIQDYHLGPGERPSRILRQAAKEYGAVVYYDRDRFVFKKPSELMARPAEFTYTSNNTDNTTEPENRILQYHALNSKTRLEDRVVRNYAGFSMTEGPIKAVSQAGQPLEFTSHQSAAILNNLSQIHTPAVEFICKGNGFLRPGMTLNLLWGNLAVDSPLDESLPEKVIIDRAVLSFQQQALYSRILGSIL